MITMMMAQKPASVSIKPPDVDQNRQLPSQQQKAGSSNTSGTTSSVGVARTAAAAGTAPEQLKCPRCESLNTKFCYYNNYSLSQPRYFCKNCRRYWTKGGSLRNVPVGGGCRKNKRVVHKQQQPSQLDPSSSLITGDHGISLGSLLPPVGTHLSSLLPRFPGGAVTSNSSPYGLTFSRLQESLLRSGSDGYQQPGMNPNSSTPSLLLHTSQPRYSSVEEHQTAASLSYPQNSVNAQTERQHVDHNRLRLLFDTGEHDSMQFTSYDQRHGSSSDSQPVSNGSAAHDLKQQLYHPKSAMQLLQEQQQLATGNSQCMPLPGFEQQAGGSLFVDTLGQNTPGNNFWVINNNQNPGWPEFYPFSSSSGGPPT